MTRSRGTFLSPWNLPSANPRRDRPLRAARRSGAITVEVAFVAPLLFLFLFGAVEFARLNMLRNTVENAAYEGARRAVVPGATAAEAQTAALQALGSISVNNPTVQVSPATLDSNTTNVTVQVNVPLVGNAWLLWLSNPSGVVSRSCTLTCERAYASGS